MLLLRANNIRKIYGDRTVLEVDSLLVYRGDRIGVVGANGAGKTTLFDILAGTLVPEEGTVQRYGEIAYCRQFETDMTRTFTVASGREERFWKVPQRAGEEHISATISGGEEMRRRLAEVFSGEKHLLLLDEPTANLDSEGVELLLNQLRQVESFLCISHDRELLTQVCSHILEVADGKLRMYEGNFTAYERQKQEERERAQREYEDYSQEKARLTAVYRQKREAAERMVKIPKNMTPREARLRDFLTVSGRNSSGKQKSMNRQADNVKKRLEHMDAKEKPKEIPVMRLAFEQTDPPESKRVLEVKGLTFGYGERLLFEEASFSLSNRKKTALMGPNGVGKTTLLRLLEQAAPDCIRLVPKARLGVLRQDFSQIDPTKTVLENALSDSVQQPSVVKSVLAGMLFGPDQWNKQAGVLSGGEKMRLAFVMLFVSAANVLFLDEPTNYLDLPSIEALERQLNEYEGAVLFVSHDREFVRQTAQELLILEDRRITRFAGGLSAYEEELQRRAEIRQRETGLAAGTGGLTMEERMRLELRQAKLAGQLGHAPSLEEKERLEAEYWEVTRLLRK